MADKITFDDKVSLTTSALPRANKCTDDDLNEIKQVVNNNADETDENTSAIGVLNEKMEGTTLYEDNTGASAEGTDITLSESLANFTRLVFYSDEGQNVGEHLTEMSGNIHLQQFDQGSVNTTIRGIRITITNNTTLNIYTNKTSSYDGTGWSRSGTLLTIKKIIGYKY